MAPASFAILGGSSPWVYALAVALAQEGHPTLAIAPYDSRTYRRLSSAWPADEAPPGLSRERWVLPPGYAGALAPLFNPLLRHRLRCGLARLAAGGGAPPWVITPYPWFGSAVAGVPGERLIYFNYDDYPLFRAERAAKILRQERALVRRARLTLCSSQAQVATLGGRYPEKADAIRHFPHGVLEKFLNPDPTKVPPARTVGYVGNLIDRVDWGLVRDVAERMPDVEFIFVGGLQGSAGGGTDPGWEDKRAAALARPNVRRVGPVAQHEVAAHYWGFAVNWVPYATDHAFNRACCPTKIMDGLASGQPLVSTDVPECRLYPAWISIARDAAGMARLLGDALAAQSLPAAGERAARQVEFARGHLWRARAQTLSCWLADPG